MGFLGNVIGGKQKYDTTFSVKNPHLQQQIDALMNDYDSYKPQNDLNLEDYISQYTGDNENAKIRTGQEISNLDRYYDGGVERQLAGLRAGRRSAVLDAAQRSQALALRGRDLARLGGDAGPSSFDKRLALGQMNGIETQAALDNATQERGDAMYLNDAMVNLTGRRQGLADALAGRALMPANSRMNYLNANSGAVGNLTALDQANKFYGLEKRSRGGVADFFDAADQGIMNVLAGIGSAYSGGQRVNLDEQSNPNAGGGGGGQLQMSRSGSMTRGGYQPDAYYAPDIGMAAYPSRDYYDYPQGYGGGYGGGYGVGAGYDAYGGYGYGGGDLYGEESARGRTTAASRNPLEMLA